MTQNEREYVSDCYSLLSEVLVKNQLTSNKFRGLILDAFRRKYLLGKETDFAGLGSTAEYKFMVSEGFFKPYSTESQERGVQNWYLSTPKLDVVLEQILAALPNGWEKYKSQLNELLF